MITLNLENSNRLGIKELFVGNQKRLATASCIQFIDEYHFVISCMVGLKLYLYKIDGNNFILLDSIDTTYKGNFALVDLINLRNNYVVGSNFNEGTQTLYKIENNKIEFHKYIPDLNLKKNYCHGVKFYSDDIICTTGNKIYNINFIDIKNDIMIFTFGLPNLQDDPKDIEFINETNSTKMFVLTTQCKVLNKSKKYNSNSAKGKIMYCDINLEKKHFKIINEFVINNSHTDSIVYYKNLIFTNNQSAHTVDILFMQNNKIHYLKSLGGFSFPHGVAIEPINNLLGITNYGTNSINIITLSDDILEVIKKLEC